MRRLAAIMGLVLALALALAVPSWPAQAVGGEPAQPAMEKHADTMEMLNLANAYGMRLRQPPQRSLQAGITASLSGQTDKAIELLTEAINSGRLTREEWAQALTNRAFAWERKGIHLEAIKDFGQVLEIAPGRAAIHFYRGNAWRELGSLDKAMADYNQAVTLNPRHKDAFFNRGGVEYFRGQYNMAIDDFTQALKLDPTFAEAYFMRSQAREMAGDLKAALADMDRYLDLKITDPQGQGQQQRLLRRLDASPEAAAPKP